MPKLLTDDEVLGASAPSGLLTDEEVLGQGKPSSAGSSKASEFLPVILGGINRGGRGLARMVTDAAQAPIDTINAGLANIPAAADRLLTKGLTEFLPLPSGKPWQENEALQQVGRTMSAVAADTRERNRNDDDQSLASWLNPRTAIARVGLGLERRMASDQAEESAMIASAAPNITAQAKAISDADGVVGTAKAIARNPAGMLPSLAESLPAMVAGFGISGRVGTSTMRAGLAEADAAAARVAGAGGDAAAQSAARAAVVQRAEQLAVSRASFAGAGTEAVTSASQSGSQAYDNVMATPLDVLAKQSERFRALQQELGSPERARERLANEVRDQTVGLVAAATYAGSRVVNKAFGEDTTARLAAGVGKSSVKDIPKNMAHEGLEEVAQGIGQDLAEHGAATQADPNHKLDLGGSAVQNFVAGAAMGGPGTTAKVVWDKARGATVADVPPGVPGTPTGQSVPDSGPAVSPSGPTVAAGVAAETNDAEKALFTPRALTSLDRVDEINAERGRAEQRLAELNRPDAGYGPMFDTERQELGDRIQALEGERDALTKDWPKAVGGGQTSFTTEAGARVDARYALVNADDLVTSHDSGLRPNPAYPQELQPRERERAASEMQVSGIVQRLDPARLGLSADAANGAPIIGADGLVESGNARSIALKRVYRVPGEKADAYKTWLRENAAQFGLDPEAVDTFDKPVLVRVRQTPVDRAEFARQANASTVATMSPSEQARSDANRIDTMEDLQPDEQGDFSGPASMPFVRRFMAKLPATEQAGMIDASGRLSTAGYARVRNAVLARAYGNSPVLARLTESLDDNLRNVSKALLMAAPRVAQMREAIDAGARHDADLTPDILAAVEELSRIKEDGRSVADALAQAGLLGDQFNPETREILQFLADNIRRPRRIADFIGAALEALDAAGDPNHGSMFDDAAAPRRADLIEAARKAINDEAPARDTQRRDAGEGAPPGAEAGSQTEATPGDRVGDQGAGTSGAAGAQRLRGESWVRFPEDLGSLNIPRAEMPQLRGDARGALVNFLEARGISHETAEVPADQLLPTQAEFSPDKVRGWAKVREGSDRSVLVAADGRILDGHHQWLDALARGAEVKAIRFSVPIDPLLAAVREFPSVERSDESSPVNYEAPLPGAVLPAELVARADEFLSQNPPPSESAVPISPAARKAAMAALEPLQKAAAAAKADFDAAIVRVAREVGALGQKLAPVKGIKRAAEKVVLDYNGDATQIGDLLRATIIVADYGGLQAVLDRLGEAFDVVAVKNRTDVEVSAPNLTVKTSPDGYMDVLLNVRVPGGVRAEIQINMPAMMAAKDGPGHKLYEVARAMPEGDAKRAEANSLMSELYAAALRVSRDSAASTTAAGLPAAAKNSASVIADQRAGHQAVSDSPAEGLFSSSENRLPSGNSTYDSSTPSSSVRSMPNRQPAGNLSGTSTVEPPAPILSADDQQRVVKLREFAARVAANWTAAPEVIVVSSMQDQAVPPEVRELDAEQKSQGASGEPDGFFHKGKVYLVANQLPTEADAARVLFHEALGHYGLRGVFGDTLKPILLHIAQARPDLMNAKAAEYGLNLASAQERLQVAEEVLAELAQSKPDLGFVRRAAAAVRTWLRANVPGMAQMRLTNDEIVRSYILPARGWVERGRTVVAADSAPVLSRRAVDTSKTAAERADEIIATKVTARRPVDAVFSWAVNDVARLPKVIEAGIRATSAVLDRTLAMLPQSAQEAISAGAERVRAGIVSDYGVPEAVIDQRAMLQGRQRVQLRQAGKLVDQLANLTRAESRVAYEWMNEQGDTERAAELMKQLPPESVKVLESVRDMIDRLSQDAVQLGQLSAEAFERNRFAYLRRSYAKHVVRDQEEGAKPRRSRTLAVLGEQYKGRGITDGASMKQIQNAAPDWWKRKLAAGKADTSLKGQKFLRLEKHAPSGEGTAPLEGMEGKARGRLLEVHYWPADEQLPAKYADWDQAGTFEARDTKGDQVVMWRDFTKAEREQMGEVDEARFAIAKTLQGMIHDVETGRYLEWLAHKYAVKNEAAVPGELVDASESWHRAFKPGEWVQVPDSKIQGTSVAKYGKLAGRYIPGPIWNDLRQTVSGQFKPFGETFGRVLSAWKTAKTALSPATHTNNIMSNMVMADWHDLTAAHTAKALRILLGSHGLDGEGALGRAGNAVANAGGLADREAALAIVNRYKDSGGDIGSWATQEIARDQLEPLMAAIEAEAQAGTPDSPDAKLAAASAVQLALSGRLKAAAATAGKKVVTEAKTLIDLYQVEDEVFRLAQWLKAKEDGASDLEAGKLARQSFMDYSINAPWIQAMRATAFPFIAYTYRAAPMLLDIARRKPHKLVKLMTLAAGVNYLGVLLGGGGDDKERKLLPEEKAGGVWGLVPKLIRMPWNDANGSPVYLDIRRFIPVGDVVDFGAGHSALPVPPALQPGGPLALLFELVLNESSFTGKAITKETDSAPEKIGKVFDHVMKWAMPNVPIPNPLGSAVEAVTGVRNAGQTYGWTGISDAGKGRTDAFGREQSMAQAMASTVGIKVGSYPADVLRRQLYGKLAAQMIDIDKDIAQLKRQRQTNQITSEEFSDAVRRQQEKKQKLQRELAEKIK